MVRPLEYGAGLSLVEAEKRYKEAMEEFERVKSRYSGFFGRFRRNLREEDGEILTDILGVVLPLTMEDCVQDQIKNREPEIYEESLHHRTGLLMCQVMDYLANFENTGVTRLPDTSYW